MVNRLAEFRLRLGKLVNPVNTKHTFFNRYNNIFDSIVDYIFHPYYPDTGSNPSLYPQQQARKQSSSQTSSVNKFIPVISAKK